MITTSAIEFMELMDRKARRRLELNPLMDKYDDAIRAGLDMNERDKARLLALLLDDLLDGTGNYQSHV